MHMTLVVATPKYFRAISRFLKCFKCLKQEIYYTALSKCYWRLDSEDWNCLELQELHFQKLCVI